jgi:hypothetical protein
MASTVEVVKKVAELRIARSEAGIKRDNELLTYACLCDSARTALAEGWPSAEVCRLREERDLMRAQWQASCRAFVQAVLDEEVALRELNL